MRHGIRALGSIAIVVAAMVLLAYGLFQYILWGVSSPDPQVSMDQLAGLTADAVIARLGAARFDPRKPDPRDSRYKPWTPELEDERGPLEIEYTDAELPRDWSRFFNPHLGHTYDIYFTDGRVSRVVCTQKN